MKHAASIRLLAGLCLLGMILGLACSERPDSTAESALAGPEIGDEAANAASVEPGALGRIHNELLDHFFERNGEGPRSATSFWQQAPCMAEYLEGRYGADPALTRDVLDRMRSLHAELAAEGLDLFASRPEALRRLPALLAERAWISAEQARQLETLMDASFEALLRDGSAGSPFQTAEERIGEREQSIDELQCLGIEVGKASWRYWESDAGKRKLTACGISPISLAAETSDEDSGTEVGNSEDEEEDTFDEKKFADICAVSWGDMAGAFIGGAFGSAAGPGGTWVGGTLGSGLFSTAIAAIVSWNQPSGGDGNEGGNDGDDGGDNG